MFEETIGVWIKVNKITASWTEQKIILTDEKDTFTMKSLILAQDER